MVSPSPPISAAPHAFPCFSLCWAAVWLPPWHSAGGVGETISSLIYHSFMWTKYGKGHMNATEEKLF